MKHPLAGKQVYSNWRIDKNISWFNINTTILGLMYSFVTFEILWDFKSFRGRFRTGKLWLPMKYAEDYYEVPYNSVVLVGDEE